MNKTELDALGALDAHDTLDTHNTLDSLGAHGALDTLVSEIHEYHSWHGDKDVQFVRLIAHGIGALVRITDENGKRCSVILGFDPDKRTGDYDVHELDYAPRKEEKAMVARFEATIWCLGR